MDEEEKDMIRSNLSDLILHTNCSADFLSFFHENKILSLSDIEDIAAKIEGSPRAAEFFKIIQTRTNAFPVLINGLKKYKQVVAIQILTGNKEKVELSEKELNSRINRLFRDEKLKSGISFDVAPPVHLFTGRSKELSELHEMVQRSKEGNRITVISQLTTVSGLGGIGKTQLARQYIQERREEFDDNIIWLNGESQHTLSESFRSLAVQKLNLSTKDADGKEKSGKAIAEDVYKYFEGSRALIVLDNADNSGIGRATPLSSSWLYDFLPNPHRNPDLYTLITSRNTEWGIGMKIIKLDVFTNDEAMAMVKLGLDIKEGDGSQDDAILKLAKTLQCFPLALHQAISYIYEQRLSSREYSILAYISEFESTKQEMMLSYRDVDSLDDTYLLTTSTTWKITVDKIRIHSEFGWIAILLLEIMSYYNPTNIWRDLFYYIATYLSNTDGHMTIEHVNDSIKLLVKYSMINSTSRDQSILSIHRLVQTVTRLQIELSGNDTPFYAAILCLENFCRDEGSTFHARNVEHGIAVWRHSWKHPEGILPLCRLVLLVLGKMIECVRIDEGINLYNEAMTKYKEVFKTDFEFYFKIKHLHAMMLAVKGYVEEAVNQEKNVLNEARLTFGEESGKFQMLELDISRFLNDLGKNEKNLNSMVGDFTLKKARFGANHESTMNALHVLAVSQMDNGLESDALQTFEDFIMKYKTVYGANNSETLEAEANVAKIYFKMGKREEALQLIQTVHEKFLKLPEKYSAELATLSITYAYMLQNVKRSKDAVKILESCIQKLKERFDDKNLWMPKLLETLGIFQLASGKPKEALATHWKALEIGKTAFGENSFQCLTYKKLIALDLLFLGKIKESMSLLIEVENQIDSVGKLDLEYYSDFVFVLTKSGNDLEALELIFRMKTLLKEDSTKLNIFSEKINIIQRKIKFEKEIKNYFRAALGGDILPINAHSKLSQTVFPKLIDFTEIPDLFALHRLFSFRFDIRFEYFERSLTGLQEVYNLMEKGSMINQKPALNVLIAIGDVYFGMKNLEQAFVIHKTAYEKLSDIHGNLYVTTIETKIRIATDLFCKGSHHESFVMFKEITQILRELEDNNPNDNDLTLNMLNYAMETVTILFKNNSPRSKEILTDIETVKESLEPEVLCDQLKFAEKFITRGRYEEALKMYTEVYQNGDSPIWKADISEAASACKDLAHVLNQLGKHEEALEIIEGNLELVKLNLGSEHHWTYFLQGSLADACRGLGNFREAYSLHNEVYQGLLTSLDEDHEDMLILKKEIAIDLSVLGRHEESNCLFLEALDKLEEISGDKGYGVILTKIQFAEAIERANEGLHDALEILVSLNEVMIEVLDKESILFQRSSKVMNKIKDKPLNDVFDHAEEFIKSGNYEGALKIYNDVVYRKGDGLIYKANVNLFASAGKKDAFILNKMGKHKESVEFLEKVLELVENEVGKEDPLIVSVLWSLASLHQSQGNFDMALAIRQNAIQLVGNETKIKIML